MNDQNPPTIKGLFYKSIIAMFKKQGRNDILEILKKEFGDLNFSSLKNYPVEMDNRFQKVLCQALYGNNNPESHFKLSRDYFWPVVGNSIATKTIFSLCQNNPVKVLQMFVKINNVFTSGIESDVKITPNQAVIRLANYYNFPEHYQGVIYGGIASLGYTPEVNYIQKGDHDYEFTVKWSK